MEIGRQDLEPGDQPVQANRNWWNRNAREYLDLHGDILGTDDFIWGPEGLHESDVALLGTPRELSTKRILEVGAGAAQCSRYLSLQGHDVTASDIAPHMLDFARHLNNDTGVDFPLVEANALNLPFDPQSFDIVFTSFGVVPFIENLQELHTEIRRVLRTGGRWVFSTVHPARWMFPDDPSRRGLSVTTSYFDRRPYIERISNGSLEYAEFHHTLADHINSLTDCGFAVLEVIEPEWPAGRNVVWGGWGPDRSPMIPGTLIIAAQAT